MIGRTINVTFLTCSILNFLYSLPVSVTHPSSLMTWGCGLSCFIVSSSLSKSLLSDSGELSGKEQNLNQPKMLCQFDKLNSCFKNNVTLSPNVTIYF